MSERAPGAESPPSIVDTLALVAQVLRSRWRALVGWPVLAGLLALGATYLVPPTFTARASLLPPQQQQSAAAAALASLGNLSGGLAGAAMAARSPAEQYASLMVSRVALDRIVDRFQLMTVYEADFRVDARRELERNTRIGVGKKDGLITIEVDDHDPQRSADIANAYVDVLRHLTSTLAISEAQQRRQFFENLLKQTRDDLAKAQLALEGSGIGQGLLRAEPKSAAESYARLKAEVTATEVRLQALLGRLTPAASEVVQTEATLTALREKLRQQEVTGAAGGQRSDYIGRYREYKYQETLFDLFSRQYELARVDESREGPLIQVLDAAVKPEKRSWPRRTLTAIVATGCAAVVLALYFLLSLRMAPGRPRPPAVAP